MQKPIKNGITKMRVMKKAENGKLLEIFDGIVVAQTTSFVRLYHVPRPNSDEKAYTMSASEWFPLKGRFCWCEYDGEVKGSLPIPADL